MKVLFQTIVILCSLSMANCLRILFLHGSGGRGAHFQKSMQCLLDRITAAFVDVEFVFPDAIYEKEDGGYCWWTFPAEGLRSTDSPELIGREASVDFVLSHKPCDVIVGHSQGAMLAAAATAQAVASNENQHHKYWTPQALIISGAAFPSSLSSLFDSVKGNRLLDEIESVHAIGRADSINSPESATKLARIFKSPILLNHGGGHVFPQDEESIKTYMDVLSSVRPIHR